MVPYEGSLSRRGACDVEVVGRARTGLLPRRQRRHRLDVALRQRGPDDGPQGGRDPGRAGRFRHRAGDARRASSRASRRRGRRRGGRPAARQRGEAVDPRRHRRYPQLRVRAARVGDGDRPGGRRRDRGRPAVGAGARPSLVGGQGGRGVVRERLLRRRVRCCGRRADPRRGGDIAGVGERHGDPVGGIRRRLARRGDAAVPDADLPAESELGARRRDGRGGRARRGGPDVRVAVGLRRPEPDRERGGRRLPRRVGRRAVRHSFGCVHEPGAGRRRPVGARRVPTART